MMIVVQCPMLILIRACFLLPTLPAPFRTLTWLNPIAYAVDAFRGGLTGLTVLLPLPVEIAVLALTTLASLAAGLRLFQCLLAGWLRSGSLGVY
jgi:ABC-type polysaccharide/polyol phosphate export permease